MKQRLTTRIVATLVATLLGISASPSAIAADAGTKSLAAVLTAKSSYDNNSDNYDILTAAVLAVLKAKPMSSVKVLTDGTVALTAFIPNDGAFKKLVAQLTNKAPSTEEATFAAVAGLGIDTVEQVLLYHVVPGTAILSGDALKANGVTLTTALTGKTFAVAVAGTAITLADQDPIAPNPTVILSQVDINKGNVQIAHGINTVLLPVPLLKPLGTKSLAAVLTAKSSFDKDMNNFDILTAAVSAVLKAKPNSPVKVLTDGSVAVTAFIPNDLAFKALARSVSKKSVNTEKAAFDAIASLGIDTVEQVLLYHVIPGATIVSEDALKSNGAKLTTALTGKSLTVSVRGMDLRLIDAKMPYPKVELKMVDINRGNLQIAHAISSVLTPTK
jgi:uncharacterized surface protein with fasciclin (FAS1) repeats